MSEQKPGIYCIEGVPDQEGEISARPMLEMLSQAHGFRFIHRVAVTNQEFFHHFLKWAGRDDYDYPILYLWYHGYPEGISLNSEDHPHRTSIGFDDIVNAQGAVEYNWEKCIIHFGACSTLDVDPCKICRFLRDTRLTAISGYTDEVGWIDGAPMELLYLSCLYDIFGENKNRRYLSQKIMGDCWNKLRGNSPSRELANYSNFKISIFGEDTCVNASDCRSRNYSAASVMKPC